MPEQFPQVSVIIPVHNRALMLERAVRSVLAQTHGDFEVLIVDDASTDDTGDAARSFADPRVQYLLHETNKGSAAARNTGIRAARAEYVAFLDSDDEWLPEKLESQLARFGRDEASARGGGGQGAQPRRPLGAVVGRYLRGGAAKGQMRTPFRGYVYPRLFKHGGGYFLSTMLSRRACLAQAGGFDEQVPALQWWDLSVRIAEHWEFDDIEVPVCVQHDHPGPRVRTDANVAKAHARFLEKYNDPAQPHFREFQSHLRWALGLRQLGQRQFRLGLREIGRGIALRPPPALLVRESLTLVRGAIRRR